MTISQRKQQISAVEAYTPIIVNAVAADPSGQTAIRRICWNTGEEKNCPSCYLSKGCKAK